MPGAPGASRIPVSAVQCLCSALYGVAVSEFGSGSPDGNVQCTSPWPHQWVPGNSLARRSHWCVIVIRTRQGARGSRLLIFTCSPRLPYHPPHTLSANNVYQGGRFQGQRDLRCKCCRWAKAGERLRFRCSREPEHCQLLHGPWKLTWTANRGGSQEDARL